MKYLKYLKYQFDLLVAGGLVIAGVLATLFFVGLSMVPPLDLGSLLALAAGAFWVWATGEFAGAFFELLREGP